MARKPLRSAAATAAPGGGRGAVSPPWGQGLGTSGSPASPLTQDEAHGIDAGHQVDGVPLEGLQQVGHAVLQGLGRQRRCWVPLRVPKPPGPKAHPGANPPWVPPAQALGTCGWQ